MAIVSQSTRKPRRDGWTPERRAQFLDHLARGCDVRRACACVGMSRQKAYALRGRDAGFARAWDEALRTAGNGADAALLAALPENLLRTMSAMTGEGCVSGGAFLPLDRVTPGPSVSPSCGGMVPAEGFEPPTFGLQNRCTTTVLSRHARSPRRPARVHHDGPCSPSEAGRQGKGRRAGAAASGAGDRAGDERVEYEEPGHRRE